MTRVRRMQLVRIAVWAGAATIAVLAAMAAANTQTGIRRIAALVTPETAPRGDRTAANRSFDVELEARRLNEAVRVLAADRDRLLARVAVLERNVEDVTGSITGSIPSTPPAGSSRPPQSLPQIPPMAATPPPVPAPVATMPASPAPRVTTTAGPQESVATKTEFGVELGSQPSVEGLRALWANLKTSQPTLLDGLRPVIAIRDGGRGVELRLVVGPVVNAAAAAKLCAALAAAGQYCQSTVFDGQRLALQ